MSQRRPRNSKKGHGQRKVKCGKCKEDIAEAPKREEEESIMCSKCNIWFHRYCTSLDEEEFRVLQRGKENLVYSCDECIRDHGHEIHKFSAMEAKLDTIMTIIKDMKQDILNEVECKIQGKIDEKMEEIEKKITKQIEEKSEEQEEREKRKNNLIIFQLPESKKETKEDREEEDIRAAHNILSKVTNIKKPRYQSQ